MIGHDYARIQAPVHLVQLIPLPGHIWAKFRSFIASPKTLGTSHRSKSRHSRTSHLLSERSVELIQSRLERLPPPPLSRRGDARVALGAGMGNVARSKTPRGEGLVPRSRQTDYQPRSRATVGAIRESPAGKGVADNSANRSFRPVPASFSTCAGPVQKCYNKEHMFTPSPFTRGKCNPGPAIHSLTTEEKQKMQNKNRKNALPCVFSGARHRPESMTGQHKIEKKVIIAKQISSIGARKTERWTRALPTGGVDWSKPRN